MTACLAVLFTAIAARSPPARPAAATRDSIPRSGGKFWLTLVVMFVTRLSFVMFGPGPMLADSLPPPRPFVAELDTHLGVR